MPGFESLGQIMPRAVKRKKIAGELLALEVKKNLEKSLQLALKTKTPPGVLAGKFSYGVLTVLTPDPSWSGLLREKEAEILKNLNSALRGKVVEKLRFRVSTKYRL